jgi:ferredoxin
MKIVVDYDLCEANARCMEVAPDLFKVDDEDNLNVLVESPGEDRRAALEEAVRLCPRQAISIQED